MLGLLIIFTINVSPCRFFLVPLVELLQFFLLKLNNEKGKKIFIIAVEVA